MTNSATHVFPPSALPLEPAAEADAETLLERAVAALGRQSPRLRWLEVVLLVLLIGFADYLTGYEVSVVLFYSLPILIMVRFADRQSAIFTALLCSLAWWWADEASGHHYTTIWHQIWETGVRLSYFLLFVAGGQMLKSRIALLDRTQRLEQEIIRISEHEQYRIGQDLHDGICQYFAAVGFSAGSVKARLERAGAPEAAAVSEVQTLILDGVQQIRSLARGLFPVQNDEWGLPSALTELTVSTTSLLNVRCQLIANVSSIPVDRQTALHLFRIAQEALSNAIRHAQASAVTIRLTVAEEELTLAIEDNGCGFAPGAQERTHTGLGIATMQYRAQQMGGRMTFANCESSGVVVCCTVPLPVLPSAR